MQYQPIITKTAVILDLHKPIYDSFYAIWNKWLKIAKARNLNIVVKTKFGISTYTYSSYMDGAKRIERYYKNPNKPMVFYVRSLLPDIAKRDKRKKIEKKLQEGFNLKGREQLLKAWKEIQNKT